jgi:ubiquinone/menaquinone biosynthesis C-methylase UbiE
VSPEVHHPLFARLWVWMSRGLEKRGVGDQRQRLLSGLEGNVIEVGAGNGSNFAHYPAAVTRVLAVEPEEHLRQLAVRAARRAPVEVEVVDGLAERLPAPDGRSDVAVVSWVLCSVFDQATALGEIRRVLRPGGRLRFLEHVASDRGVHRRFQQLLDATIWPRVGGGCHASRDTVARIEEAGFTVTDIDRFRFPDTRLPLPTSPNVLGEAATTTPATSAR